MKRKKISTLIGLMGLGVIVGMAVFLNKKSAVLKSPAEALGLRGTSKVSRPLSATQVKRLETHFLNIPVPQTGGAPTINETVGHVDAINRLNARQAGD